MRNKALFGPGGNSEAFYRDGCKSTRQAPAWVKRIGLDAYEFEAGNGIESATTAAIDFRQRSVGNRLVSRACFH